MANQKNQNKTCYVGLCTTYHDPAIAIIDDQGAVLFAEATERCLQYKRGLNCYPDSLTQISELISHYAENVTDFVIARNWNKQRPWYEIMWWLAGYFSPAGLTLSRHKKLSTFLPKYKLLHMLACQKYSMAGGGLNLVRMLRELKPDAHISIVDFNHHLCHAAVACYSSPYEHAACVIVDSFGDHGSSAFYQYNNGKIKRVKEISGIESLGFFYMRLTELCGFDWIKGEEWKVMGLAAYGEVNAEVCALLKPMLAVRGLGFKQNLAAIHSGFPKIEQLIEDKSIQIEDIACTGQHVFENFMLALLNHFSSRSGSNNLVLGGGCLLNSSLNGKILAETAFQSVHIPSAPGDDGTALGAAYLAYQQDHPHAQWNAQTLTPYLGSSIDTHALQRLLKFGQHSQVFHYPQTIADETAKLLAQGALVGWVQGRAEYGPRALGNRSILADPRQGSMRDKINNRVKFREQFRPFAPSILDEYGDKYFENYQQSPYMERTLKFKEQVCEKVPAVVHVDGTGRLQTVKHHWNPRFYQLIEAFRTATGIPLLLNTSFNVMGKPIIHTVEDAVSVFYTTGLDVLVIDDYMIIKPEFMLAIQG
ncbi:MAG TPA: nodulation protein nolNO [Crenotrichaceae bacterium]|nr:nodulation protein nolNO [Crenotrichaceae bacterium]